MIGRDSKGHFLPGHSVRSPGRPTRASEADYLAAMTELVTLDVWKKIVKRAISDALAGNGYARAWIADYVIGKAPQTINLTASDSILLKQVLTVLEKRGVAPKAILEALLAELDNPEMEVIQTDEYSNLSLAGD